MKTFLYAVQEAEKPIFEKANKKYNNELCFTSELLNRKNVQQLPEGTEAVVLFVNCQADREVLNHFKKKGVKYIVTRSVGTDHIDLDAATELGYKVARVPSYSPTAVASLAFSGGMDLLRRSSYMFYHASQGNFEIDNKMFANEFKNLTIGIIGTGRIGYETAKYWKGTGAKIVGYDIYQNDFAKKILDYVELDELIKKADLISIHIPHIPGKNDNFVDEKFINKMKTGASLVNVSRAALIDQKALVKAIKTDKIYGYSADVFKGEEQFIGKKISRTEIKKINPSLAEMLDLYPRVLISPHVAYFTDEAVKNMADVSFLNLDQLRKYGKSDTQVN